VLPRATKISGVATSARSSGRKIGAFLKRDPEIEAIYPGHLLPSSPQMLEELLRRSLELEQSLIIFLLSARSTKRKAGEHRQQAA
jgi:hypothetical protein